MEVKLSNVRLSFPNLFTPKSVNGGAPKYSASFLLDKVDNEVDLRHLKEAMKEVASDKWPSKIPSGIKSCLHDGSEKEDKDGYGEGVMYINSNSDQAPAVVDGANRLLNEASGKPYGGCYVNAVIQLWAQDNQFGKRINAQLLGVQFVKDGDRFGRAPFDPNQAFTTLETAGVGETFDYSDPVKAPF